MEKVTVTAQRVIQRSIDLHLPIEADQSCLGKYIKIHQEYLGWNLKLCSSWT